MQKKNVRYNLSKALTIIFLSTTLISGSAFALFFGYKYYNKKKQQSEKYLVEFVAQKSKDANKLNTIYLTELLHLSVNKKQNIYQFDKINAVKKLLAAPFMEEAEIKPVLPNTLYIEYKLRNPIAFLTDFTNVAIDQNKNSFPFYPFYTPKKLPKIYLGVNEERSSDDLEIYNKKIEFAIRVIRQLNELVCDKQCQIALVDVSKIFASSYGERELIITLEEFSEPDSHTLSKQPGRPVILRLNPKNYLAQIINYKLLKKKDLQKFFLTLDNSKTEEVYSASRTRVVDLRIARLAFIKEY